MKIVGMCIVDISDEEKELRALVKTMDVPIARVKDYIWLGKNLMINNSDHPNYARVIELLKQFSKGKVLE